METLLRPVIISTSSRPAATASSTTYWIAGLSTTGSISFGVAFVAGRNRVPRPAAGMTALRMRGRVSVMLGTLMRHTANGRGTGGEHPALSRRESVDPVEPVDDGTGKRALRAALLRRRRQLP